MPANLFFVQVSIYTGNQWNAIQRDIMSWNEKEREHTRVPAQLGAHAERPRERARVAVRTARTEEVGPRRPLVGVHVARPRGRVLWHAELRPERRRRATCDSFFFCI